MADVVLEQGQMKLSGQIGFENADAIYQKGLGLLKNVQSWPVAVNLSNVEHGNTLLLAVILQWLRQCPDMGDLQLVHVPEKMQRIVEASHLDMLIHH